jgi:kynurenine formamidase
MTSGAHSHQRSMRGDLPGIVIRAPFERGIEIGPDAFFSVDVCGKAVLAHTGWDRFWNTLFYNENHLFLNAAPPKFEGVGTFPVRAFARIEEQAKRPYSSAR